MRFAARFAAIACIAAAGAALAEPDIKPWKGKDTLPLAGYDIEGNAVDLKDLQGRVLVVNFWATWCEPCRDEMPSLQRLREKLDPKHTEDEFLRDLDRASTDRADERLGQLKPKGT